MDYRCGIIDVEGDPAHPLNSDLLEDLLVDTAGQRLRVATFEVDLSGEQPGELAADLAGGQNPQALRVAAAIQEANADLVLLTGFDADESAVRTFTTDYLETQRAVEGAAGYPYHYVGPSNLGVPSGADLDQDKIVGGPGDSWGYGQFPGQGSMVLLSRHPIDQDNIQTLTKQRWSDLPASQITEAGLSEAVAEAMPVMESGLWDVPITIAGHEIRVIAIQTNQGSEETSYTAPRQNDQLAVVGDWLSAAEYISDDDGARPANAEPYVVLGELGRNAQHNASVDALLEKIGVAEQGIHDERNYILPDSALEITRHGSVKANTVEQAPAETEPANGTAELLWSDLKF